MSTSRTRPLDGITVLALEHAVAAPYATRLLADLGARVIKVERRSSGDFARHYDRRVRGESSYFVWINRGKESLALDLKHAEAQAILQALVARADVLVQNLAPGAAARLGLSALALRAAHPRLTVCDITGYGSAGPWRDRKAYDLLIQAEAGLLSITGTPGQMARAGISVADIAAGMFAHGAILAALIHRGRTGQGDHIEVSMLDALAEWMGNPLYYAHDGQPQAPRSGASHPSLYPYGPFATGDGRSVLFGLQNEREWVAFCEQVLLAPELATDARFATSEARHAQRGALGALIDARLAQLSADQAQALLDRAGIAYARVNAVADLWSHEQLRVRDRWAEVGSPGGRIAALKPPAIHDGFEPRMDAVPTLGEHSAAILREIGCDDAAIERLRALSVI